MNDLARTKDQAIAFRPSALAEELGVEASHPAIVKMDEMWKFVTNHSIVSIEELSRQVDDTDELWRKFGLSSAKVRRNGARLDLRGAAMLQIKGEELVGHSRMASALKEGRQMLKEASSMRVQAAQEIAAAEELERLDPARAAGAKDIPEGVCPYCRQDLPDKPSESVDDNDEGRKRFEDWKAQQGG